MSALNGLHNGKYEVHVVRFESPVVTLFHKKNNQRVDIVFACVNKIGITSLLVQAIAKPRHCIIMQHASLFWSGKYSVNQKIEIVLPSKYLKCWLIQIFAKTMISLRKKHLVFKCDLKLLSLYNRRNHYAWIFIWQSVIKKHIKPV